MSPSTTGRGPSKPLLRENMSCGGAHVAPASVERTRRTCGFIAEAYVATYKRGPSYSSCAPVPGPMSGMATFCQVLDPTVAVSSV